MIHLVGHQLVVGRAHQACIGRSLDIFHVCKGISNVLAANALRLRCRRGLALALHDRAAAL